MENPINYNYSLSPFVTNETSSDHNLHMVMFAFLYPSAIVLNLLLVIIILVRKDLREDQSRWTLLHASIVGLIFLINSFVYAVEKFKNDADWLASNSCEMTTLLDGVVSHVAKFAILLVTADRVIALWRPADFPRGLSQTSILVSILVMWLVNIFIFPTVYFKVFDKAVSGPGHYFDVCHKAISSRYVSIYYVWPYLPIFLAIICDIVALIFFTIRRHEYINENSIRAITIPTLTMDLFFVSLYFPYMVMLFCFATDNYLKFPELPLYMLIILFWSIYPLVWLLSRDIRREMCGFGAEEEGETARLISIENVQEFAVQDRPAQITIKLPPPTNN